VRAWATYLFAFGVLYLTAGMIANGYAQARLGVVWDIPEDIAEAQQQLEQFSDLGITYLEIQEPVNESALLLLQDTPFSIYVRSDEAFHTLSDITNHRNKLIEKYRNLALRYRPELNVVGLGLLTNSQTSDPDFSSAFSPVLNSLKQVSNKSFYFFRDNSWYHFDNPERAFGVYFNHKEFTPYGLILFDKELKALRTQTNQQILFIPSAWLLEGIKSYPELAKGLHSLKNKAPWVLPLPNSSPSIFSPHWMVLILLLLWGALAIQIKYLPYVRPMMLRYFLAHGFYVNDILHYRERAALGGILLMGMHAIFSGMVAYVCAHLLLTEAGMQAFFHHFPYLAITGTNYVSFFFMGIILLLLTQIIAVFWLYLPAKNLGHISQAINLYAGAFYADFLLLTVILTLFMAGTGSLIILILSAFFILIWYAAFNLAAIDASQSLGPGKILYLLLTVGLHTIITVGLLIAFLNMSEMLQAVNLALSI
jgi:hypothetical protein